MFKTPLEIAALALTVSVALWGIIAPVSLSSFADGMVATAFASRGWLVMLAASVMLVVCLALLVLPVGNIRLGRDDDEPEFSTGSWLTMMFAAGMGVGLLFYGITEPASHFVFLSSIDLSPSQAAEASLTVTIFH